MGDIRRRWRQGLALIAAAGLWAPLRGDGAAFLFDATKAQLAGNADWVLDQDSGVVGRFPTPAASGITAATTESYWLGALSAWGVALVKLGHTVESLPIGGRITYGDATNAQDLSNYTVFVVCEPNIAFTSAEKTAIVSWVLAGGRLFAIGNHGGSDRNNDGWDPVRVWNDLIDTNGVQANPFGFRFNSNSISLTTSLVDPDPLNPLTRGPAGTVTQLKYSAGATMTISPLENPGVRAVAWRTANSDSAVMAAYGTAGFGRFAAIGDSSPPDDGTGAPGNTLYPGWTELASHAALLLNASIWLAADVTPPNDARANATEIPLAEGSLSATGSNRAASAEAAEPAHAGQPAAASVWWRFAPLATGSAVLSTAGSGFDTTLAVYAGNATVALASNDDAPSVTTSALTLSVVAGQTYLVAVDGKAGATGTVRLNLDLPSVPPPANDAFAAAAIIPAEGVSDIAMSTRRSSAETGEPAHAGRAAAASTWWQWTAPAGTQSATVSTAGSGFDTRLAVYRGNSLAALTSVTSDTDSFGGRQSAVRFATTPGETYRIAVDGEAGAVGALRLALVPSGQPAVRPANDAFATPATLGGSVSATNDFATAEGGEPAHAGQAAAKSLWWTWTAPTSGLATIATSGGDFDTTLAVYRGSVLASLTPVASNDDASTGVVTSTVSFSVTAGQEFRVALAGKDGRSGTTTLTASVLGGPANDNFANAAPLVALTANGTNVNATREEGEPVHYSSGGQRSVWWVWTAPEAGTWRLDTEGSTFDTTLAVYTGSALAALTRIANDDDSGAGTTSRLAFTATDGGVYRIAVDGYSASSTGTIALRLTKIPPPANDGFANATVLTGAAPTASGENEGATIEEDEPNPRGWNGTHSVWWRWTAPTTSHASVSVSGVDFFSPTVAVFTGDSVDALILLTTARNGFTSFATEAGTTYLFRVDGSSGASGAFTLAVNGTLPAARPYAFFWADQIRERSAESGRLRVYLDEARPSQTAVGVTLSGNATIGEDYELSVPRSGNAATVTFAPLETFRDVTFTARPDADPSEFTESVVATVGTGNSTLMILDDTPYEAAWVAAAGTGFRGAAAGLTGDFDGDGLPNLAEWGLGGNPAGADASARPTAGVMEINGESFATLSFPRRRNAPTLRYRVEASTDLARWMAAVEVGTVVIDATWEKVTFRAPMAGRAVFLRLLVDAL